MINIWVLVVITFFSTLFGGLLALKYKGSLPYFFAFASGSLIAVSFLDLLPESINLANSISLSTRTIMSVVVVSFLFYTILEKFLLTHHHHENDEHGHIFGPVGAGSLILHSFLDGIAIGAAYQVDASLGVVTAVAVISHDITDGINTVVLMLKNKHSDGKAKVFLFFDALAPVVGAIVASIILIPQSILAIILAFFVGEFIYLGASHLLPELREHSSWKILFWMIVGILVIFVSTVLI